MWDDESSYHGSERKKPSGFSKYDLLEQHMENYDVEASALHRKLQSKVDALRIMRKELEKFRIERDQFKLMAETLQLRYSAIKHQSTPLNGLDGSKSSVAKLLHETRERNIKLTMEVEALKQKVSELQGDIDLLRSKERRPKRQAEKHCCKESAAMALEDGASKEEGGQWKSERMNLISYLEALKQKNAQLSFDFKSVIDEKEELITERDAYKCKAHRLNHELLAALRANEKHPKYIDIDSLILENKYLQERFKNMESELELTKHTMTKYKSMLDTKRKKGIIKLGSTNSSNDESILSHKQVKTMLESGIDLPTKTETIQDLKSLCLALLDNLNDKNLALNHQKKTNKVLASKIAELEERLQIVAGSQTATESGESSGCPYEPSQILLQGYCPSLVDSNDTAADKDKASDSKPEDTATNGSGSESLCGRNASKPQSGGGSGGSEDNISLFSTESGRSILSSEYAMDVRGSGDAAGPFNIRDFTSAALYAYKTPSTTTDSGQYPVDKLAPHVSASIARERMEDLKDLPPELAAMVQKALHELDMRDFDEVIAGAYEEGVGEEATEQYADNDSICKDIEEKLHELSAMN